MHDSSSGVFTALAALTTAAASTGPPFGEQRLCCPRHRAGALVDRDHRAGRNQICQQAREIVYAFVELEINRPVHMIGGQVGLPGGARETARTNAGTRLRRAPRPPAAPRRTDPHHPAANWCRWHRPPRCCPAGSLRRRRVRPSPNAAASPSPGACAPGRASRGSPGCWCPRPLARTLSSPRPYRPRNFVTLPLTIFAASAGPTASTTAASDFSSSRKCFRCAGNRWTT